MWKLLHHGDILLRDTFFFCKLHECWYMRTWHHIKTHLPCLINRSAVIPPLPIEVEGTIRWFSFVEKKHKTGQSYSQNLQCLYIFESTIEHFLLQGIFYSLGTVPKRSYSRSRGEFKISQTLDKYSRPKKENLHSTICFRVAH